MSPQQQDADTLSRSRPRANTNSFASFPWRRPRVEQPPVPLAISPPAPTPQPLSLEALIEALSPPAVPSIVHARSLSTALAIQSPLPRCAVLNPVLASLCDVESPVALQAAGYDILSAYWENHEAASLATADRLSYFSLFLGSGMPWSMDLWEARFKALRALTRQGLDIVGVETSFLNVLKSWIEGGFDGLLQVDSLVERSERAEKEHSINVIADFLTSVGGNAETVARYTEDDLAGILQFYGTLVDRAIVLPIELDRLTSPLTDINSNSSTPVRPSAHAHRRNPSSISTTSVSSPTTAVPPSSPSKKPVKHPADIAITLYLNYLASQIKTLSAVHLNAILPLLFRALAFCASPLPRLTVMASSSKKSFSEDRITEMLNSLFAGPYSTSCMLILKQHLFPPGINDISTGSQESLYGGNTPQIYSRPSIKIAMQTSLGAQRTFRNYVRRALRTRLARAYISRESSMGYSHSGAPVHMDVERDLMERAWPKEDYLTSSGLGMGTNGWDAGRMGRVLAGSVESWVEWHWDGDTGNGEGLDMGEVAWEKEKILEEAAGVLKDILQELDARDEENGGLDDEEAVVVGETLFRLAAYVRPLRNEDGTPFLVPLSRPIQAPTPFLRSLTSLLSRDHSMYLNPLLSTILIQIADNLTDTDTARLPHVMAEQHELSPTSPEWLNNWNSLLGNPALVSEQRPLTRHAVMDALESVYDSVRDMKGYRKPLADLVWQFCGRWAQKDDGEGGDVPATWKILGDEVVLRAVECESSDDEAGPGKYIDLLVIVASEGMRDEDEDNDVASVMTTETHSPSPSGPSTIVSPIISRMQSEFHGQAKEKDKESGLPSVMSILSSLATGSSSRSHSMQPQLQGEPLDDNTRSQSTPENSLLPRVVAATSALIGIFSQLAFTPYALEQKNLKIAIQIYEILLKVLTEGKSARAKIAILQFLMRLRADRDHRVFFVQAGYDINGQIKMLSSLIGRVEEVPSVQLTEHVSGEPTSDASAEHHKSHAGLSQERKGRQVSRGRVGGSANPTTSRSRSRVTNHTLPLHAPARKSREPLWHVPESLSFTVAEADTPSEALVTYDPVAPVDALILPLSKYLSTLTDILEKERNWEILSYVLCHLPAQLANKHLFCGPNSRQAISKLHSVVCAGLLNSELGCHIERWPTKIKIRDAQGLAHNILNVLVSYRRCFDMKQRHLLVEVYQAGLNGQPSTIKCCLHGLSLAAFELKPSMTKCLPRILEKLSQIMSNPDMAVHILGFLSIVGSLPPLFANFTESDFKMVFGVALQYLQHYNRHDASPTTSWALSQHVRILSYCVVYVWFLAVRLPDRPRHVRYITRQLLIANEGNDQIDELTEVCFDWLARYTYASADPRPANSLLNDIVMNPTVKNPPEIALSEKTWIMANSIVTIRTLARLGWIEVLTRRPSGFTKFLCRVENAPMVGPGDVDPDMLSVPGGLLMERDLPKVLASVTNDESGGTSSSNDVQKNVHDVLTNDDNEESDLAPPDPITGYVWSGTAPSQRRKQMAVDPAYLALQLSSYPDRLNASGVRMVTDSSALSKFVATIDRIPVIDTHKVGIMYVAPGQTNEVDILRNTYGSPAYTRFLEGLGRLIRLRGQLDVYAGGLDPNEDGEYAYAWWDDIGQILYHTATMMPSIDHDPQSNNKKRHIGNDYVRIVWNDSGKPYRFDTLATQFQFVNIVIEPHSLGAIAAFSNNLHENEYFKVTVQRAPGMTEFTPIGHFKLISAENLPLLVRQLSLLADWFASVFAQTHNDTERVEVKTNWHTRLAAIRRFQNQMPVLEVPEPIDGIMGQEAFRDFTTAY